MDDKKRKSGLSFGHWTGSSIQDITLESDAYDTTARTSYFLRQWMPILWRWNISEIEGPDGTSFDVVNRTNNGLERYNRHFNGLFNKKPSLLEFVQIVEKESCFQDQKLNDIRYGRRKEVERDEPTIPVVPVAYSDFFNLVIKNPCLLLNLNFTLRT